MSDRMPANSFYRYIGVGDSGLGVEVRGEYLSELGEPAEKGERTWAWKAWLGVWVPVPPLCCGTRGERHTDDTVMRAGKH